MKPAIERIDLGTEELNQLLERARELLSEEDYRKLKAAVDTLEYLTELVADKDTTIRHLRQRCCQPAQRRPRKCSPKLVWQLRILRRRVSPKTARSSPKTRKPGMGATAPMPSLERRR